MKYILCDNIALRSWKNIPYAYYIKNQEYCKKLKKEEFDILLKCDGNTDIPSSDLLNHLEEIKLCKKAKDGDILTSWQKYHHADNKYVPTIFLRITGKCNFNCKHCFNAADINRDLSEWTMPEIKALLDDAKECNINNVQITGGEPMLHLHFLDIIREIYARDMFVKIIVTNAHFLTKEILEELDKLGCKAEMRVSFDGFTHHDWMRGKDGAEKRALETIKLLVDNSFPVLIDAQVNKITMDTMLETAEYFDRIGVQTFRLIRTSESPRWKEFAKEADLSIDEYFDFCVSFLKKYSKKEHQMDIICWEFARFYPKNKSYFAQASSCKVSSYSDIAPICVERRYMLSIGSDGKVYPCHQVSGVYNSLGIISPNVKELGIKGVLEYKPYLDDSHMIAGKLVLKADKCAQCDYFKQCKGGCRTMALAINNDKYSPDPYACMYFTGNYEEKLNKALPNYENRFVSEKSKYVTGDIHNLFPNI